ncbi:MAG: PIG-L family deacetylase [Alphaproteobacteria bacterium]|nr:PIG-L family deacetylase [Alphaproteobacteria bacterium]
MTAPDTSPSGLVSSYVDLLRRHPAQPDAAVSFISDALPLRGKNPCALLLSPHPDDECLAGALPLRLKREQGWQIINIAVTLGSKTDHRPARLGELARACAVLGFDAFTPATMGFDDVTEAARAADRAAWQKKAARIAELVGHYKPQAIFMPHAQDAHPTHIGTHLLGMDALALQPVEFSCAVVETEYWQPNPSPNLMIGVGAADAATLLSALACHAGEVARNPYDVRFPAYLIDNVRRGSERVGGAGAPSADMDFAMLYRYGLWKSGRFMPSALGRIIGAGDLLKEILSG